MIHPRGCFGLLLIEVGVSIRRFHTGNIHGPLGRIQVRIVIQVLIHLAWDLYDLSWIGDDIDGGMLLLNVLPFG
jgi:hypothetical protein